MCRRAARDREASRQIKMLPPQQPGLTAAPKTLPPHFNCPECKSSFSITTDFFDLHFTGKSAQCPSCKQALKPWPVALEAVKSRFMFSSTFYPLGAQVTILQSRIFLNSESRLD